MENGRSSLKTLTDNPTGKRPLGRPRLKWEGNIILPPKEIVVSLTNLFIQLWLRVIGELLRMRIELPYF